MPSRHSAITLPARICLYVGLFQVPDSYELLVILAVPVRNSVFFPVAKDGISIL